MSERIAPQYCGENNSAQVGAPPSLYSGGKILQNFWKIFMTQKFFYLFKFSKYNFAYFNKKSLCIKNSALIYNNIRIFFIRKGNNFNIIFRLFSFGCHWNTKIHISYFIYHQYWPKKFFFSKNFFSNIYSYFNIPNLSWLWIYYFIGFI